MTGMWIRAVMVWLLIAVIETIHGVLRQVLLVPLTGDFTARQIGVFTGSILIVLTACATSRRIGARSLKEQIAIGVLWTAVMVIFEVSLGLLLGYSAQRILEDFDLLRGGLMPVGLLVLLLSPLLASKILSDWRQRSGRRFDNVPQPAPHPGWDAQPHPAGNVGVADQRVRRNLAGWAQWFAKGAETAI